ncbi:exopolysaccharide biosynthesis protein [Heliophilum fasciatum]|uniref:Exopolysaccharide synthesis protein ExoD n=1 Tax=Heliophilum fasciatum TaxID=35700 RepID=A0A4V2SY55_9FIRM|nr:exopolysaccharide biosynthesis protein [Heliophilum fasciatum]MCW2276833.1 hypothetical protein [Heliophilum fasciatum]TCP68706.1 hypothetical protein EDD73_102102 [Heliophilum fasciatum]
MNHQERFSQSLHRLSKVLPHDGLTLGGVVDLMGQQSIWTLCAVMTVPFLLPVSIPGSSTPIGVMIALLGVACLWDRPPALPRRVARHPIPSHAMRNVLEKASHLAHKLEALARPRWSWMTEQRLVRRLNAICLVCNALLLTLPLPLPMSNTIPAYGVLFLACGALMRDGLFVAGGYVMAVLSVIYFALVAILGVNGVSALLG